MAESETTNSIIEDEKETHLYPDLSDVNRDGDKYNFDNSGIDQLDSDTHKADTWHSPVEEPVPLNNSAGSNSGKTDPKKQEIRRNNRLQSGATCDKYKNAQRFPGGHGKANADRQKPTVTPETGEFKSHSSGKQSDSQGHHERGRRDDDRRAERSVPQSESSPQGDFVSKETDEFVYFWRIGSPFSQFHPAEFKVDGIAFNCAEQYMMYMKAKTFGDDAVADMIMKEKNPHTQKHYGRQIFAFKPEVWEPLCKDVVKKGNIAKFSQNEDLKQKLFSTYPKTLVEASPNDTVWGIGLSAENPDALQKETWRGTNLLGYILTDVRDQMLKEINFI